MALPTTESSSSNQQLPYYCYTCQIRISPITEDVVCPHCHGGFVVVNEDREADELNSAQQEQNAGNMPAGNRLGENFGSMVEASLRNAMNFGHVQPGTIAFSVNGQPPTRFTLPDPSDIPASATRRPPTQSPNDNGDNMRPRQLGIGGFIQVDNDGAPEIEMIQDIMERVFGNGGEAFMLPSMNAPWRIGGQLHGNPQDYAWGPNGFDNIISQLLGQLDNVGPPPADRHIIDNLPTVKINKDHVANQVECSVCMDYFKLNEIAKQLPCKHLFHSPCIDPWLELHNTCPICRKQVGTSTTSTTSTSNNPTTSTMSSSTSNQPNTSSSTSSQPRNTSSGGRGISPLQNDLFDGNFDISATYPTFNPIQQQNNIPPPSRNPSSAPSTAQQRGGGLGGSLLNSLFFPFFTGSSRQSQPQPQQRPSSSNNRSADRHNSDPSPDPNPPSN